MNLAHDKLLSNLAFNCNLRPYIMVGVDGFRAFLSKEGLARFCTEVRQCRLTPGFGS